MGACGDGEGGNGDRDTEGDGIDGVGHGMGGATGAIDIVQEMGESRAGGILPSNGSGGLEKSSMRNADATPTTIAGKINPIFQPIIMKILLTITDLRNCVFLRNSTRSHILTNKGVKGHKNSGYIEDILCIFLEDCV